MKLPNFNQKIDNKFIKIFISTYELFYKIFFFQIIEKSKINKILILFLI